MPRKPVKRPAVGRAGRKAQLTVPAMGRATPDTTLADFLFRLSPRFLAHNSNPYATNPWLYAGIGAIVRNVTGVPYEIRTGPRDQKRSTVIETGPWVDLFDAPNPELLPSEFWEAVICHLSLPGGQCIVVKEGRLGPITKPEEIPTELWPLSSKLFECEVSGGVVTSWTYTDPATGKKTRFKPWQVMNLKRFNPSAPYRGLGPADVVDGALRRTGHRDAYNEAFFENHAVPEGYFEASGPLGRAQQDQVEKKIDDHNRGAVNAHKYMILSGLKWVPIGTSHKDMAFQEQGIWDRDEVLAALGVPKSEIGLEQDVNMITGAGTLSRNVGFWTGTLVPMLRRFYESFWSGLFKPAGGREWGQHNLRAVPALRGNRKDLLEQATILQQQGYTQNQINEYLDLDLPKTEIGDMAFLPAGLTPIDSLLGTEDDDDEEIPGTEDDEATEAPKPPPQGEDKPEADDEDEEPKRAIALPEIVAENLRALEVSREIEGRTDGLTEIEKVGVVRAVKNFLRARSPKREEYWRQVARRTMLPIEPKFARRTRRYFMELRVEQLKRLKKLTVEPARWADLQALIRDAKLDVQDPGHDERLLELFARDTIDEVLFPLGDWNQRMKRLHHPLYVEVVTNATDQALTELGGQFSFDETDPKVVDVIAGREELLVKANTTVRRLMAREIEEGVKAGESIAEIQERVRLRFNGFSGRRSLTIARTEVAGATNTARNETFAGEGVEETQWVTARDEVVRESHREIDGETRRMGTTFSNGLAYPGEIGAPPGETINCRCVASPVV